MQFVVLLGRIFYSAIFILASFSHFSQATIDYAASMGVPMAQVAVPFSGLLALLGGLSVMLGYRAKWGALFLALFLIPVTFKMHAFWTIQDPAMAAIQQIMFMKNLSMLGGAMLIGYFGSGPMSLNRG